MRNAAPALLVCSLLVTPAVYAQQDVPQPLLEALLRMVPGMLPDDIAPAPLAGFYEVSYGSNVLYVSGDGRYALQGDLIDLETRANLTDVKRRHVRRQAIEALDESAMIVFAPEKVEHTVTVFTDVDCPYCARLHQDMASYNSLGLKIRYLAFPRAGIPSKSYTKTVSVWCSKDPRKAIGDAKFGRSIVQRSCPNPVEEHYTLGRNLGVTGTPSLLLENGEMVPGYVPPSRLLRLIREQESG